MTSWWGQAEENLRKEVVRVGGKFSLCSLSFVAPSLDGRASMEINKPWLTLNPSFTELFRSICGHLPESMSTLLWNLSRDRSHSEMSLRAAVVNEDQPCKVCYRFLYCKEVQNFPHRWWDSCKMHTCPYRCSDNVNQEQRARGKGDHSQVPLLLLLVFH